MPNWCATYITFMSDGTPEGKLALQDFRQKISLADERRPKRVEAYNDLLWEIDIENQFLSESNGLFVFGDEDHLNCGSFDCDKRGYFDYISDIEEYSNCDTFSISTDDAWAGNIEFWIQLLYTFYGTKITLNYECSEPGMGLYYSNNPENSTKVNCYISSSGTDVFNIPAAVSPEYSEGPFMFINRSNPCIYINPAVYTGFMSSYNGKFCPGYRIPIEYSYNATEDIEDVEGDIEAYFFSKPKDPCNTTGELICSIEDTYNCDVSYDEYSYSALEENVYRDRSFITPAKQLQEVRDKVISSGHIPDHFVDR